MDTINYSNNTTAGNLLNRLLDGDRAACSEIVHEYLKKNPSITDLYEEVLKVALHEVGSLWERNQISVATEHLSTAIIEGIMNELFEQIISGKKFNKKAVVACVENEMHQVGIKMVADVFEMNGWETYFLGAGIPTSELLKFIKQVNPNLIAISLSVYFNYSSLIKMLSAIRESFPQIEIIIGGQALKHLSGNEKRSLGDAVILPDLYFLERYIKTISNNH